MSDYNHNKTNHPCDDCPEGTGSSLDCCDCTVYEEYAKKLAEESAKKIKEPVNAK